MTALIPLSPADVATRLKSDTALLIDIREADEFARRHIAGALSRPLAGFEAAHLRITPDRDVIFACRTGNRTSANCAKLQSSVGGDAYNLGLSDRRAKAVFDYLASRGVDPARLSSVGKGETAPIADNATAEGRQENRRVMLIRTDTGT